MRIRVSHRTSQRYAVPPKSVIQILRLTPRNHDGQFVVRWRIDLSADCQLAQHEDAFGNITHVFTADGPMATLDVLAEGEVETRDTQGVVHGAVERFPPSMFLRETALTALDDNLLAFAEDARATAGDMLATLHLMTARLHADMTLHPDPLHPSATAAQAFAAKGGVCQDLAHMLIAACRGIGVPARYVSGHICEGAESTDTPGDCGWTEAHVPDLGWVAFDPAHGLSATDAYVRVAVGLDHLGASPVRGTRTGGGDETLDVTVRVDQGGWGWQSQRQD